MVQIIRYLLVLCMIIGLSTPSWAQHKTNAKFKSQKKVQVTEVQPTWESLNARPYPQWFSDAKLGIFIHWGVYSVPAFAGKEGYGEWFYRGLMSGDRNRAEIMKYYTDTTKTTLAQYADLVPYWHAEMWNPNQWADIFQQAGAQYVMLVTKHHDGYCLWDNPQRANWNSVMSGPHRNIVGELTEAVRNHGMKMCFYYSLCEWTNPLHVWTQAPNDSIGRYVREYMIPQFKDLVTRYRPSAIFSDGDWDNTPEQFHSQELIAWYYNTVGPEAIVNDRWGSGTQHGFRTPEYSSGITLTDRPWAECRGLGRSFALNRNEPLDNYLTSEELIRHFSLLVSAGGGMTLNVGPNADGTIPLLQQERLRDLGNWLHHNGEAIYGSRPWKHFNYSSPYQLIRTDSTINFDWVRNAPDRTISYDSFDIQWTGSIVPLYSEEYTFTLAADDHASFTLYAAPSSNAQKNTDGTPLAILSSDKNAQSVKVKLTAGTNYYAIVKYEEKDLEARIALTWSSPSQTQEAVPSQQGWHAIYSCKRPYVCFTTKDSNLYAIALECPQSKHFPTPKEGKTIRRTNLNFPYAQQPHANMKVTYLGSQRPLDWWWDETQQRLYIFTNEINYNEFNLSSGAWVFKLEGTLKE